MFALTIILSVFCILNLIALFFLLRHSGTKNSQFENLDKNLERTERSFREQITTNRTELSGSLKQFGDSISSQFIGLTKLNEEKLDNMRKTVEERLNFIQEDNTKKLEQMRETVDEKLHETLERRLGESFKLVSDKLELVHKGLGEMQSLAAGVGDLKKVLTNVKTRGTWGEIQLGSLLDQILTPEQYEKNVATKKGSNEIVEFAVKMPGRDGNITWIPIDAKFPKEDYERLVAAQEQANPVLVEEIGRDLENKIKLEAKNIRDKYVDPPHTTDFGILFLPIESLYAEVLRRPGLCELLQSKYRILVAGPTTIAAFLNSLQMGFRTLAIEKRAGEVWNLLGVVKAEFGKFGDILDKTHKKLQEASDTIEDAAKKSRTIERKLKNVEVLPNSETVKLIENADEINIVAEDKL